MATKRKEWSRRALCVGNQNKPVGAYGCAELTKSLSGHQKSPFSSKHPCQTVGGIQTREKLMEKDEMSLLLRCARTHGPGPARTQTPLLRLASFN